MSFKANEKWLKEVEKTSVKVPAGTSQKKAAEALAKELKRKGLVK